MTPLILRFMLILFIKVTCFGASQTETREYRNVLTFLNKLRNCSMESKHRGITLPELSSFTKTTNLAVNRITKDEYIMFWQTLQKQGYEKDMEQLLFQSKGSCVVRFDELAYTPEQYHYTTERRVLRPLIKGALKDEFLKCASIIEGNTLDCNITAVKNCKDYEALEKEMIKCAITFLKVSVFIGQASLPNFSPFELDHLRSNDRALSCIRDWDRDASIARILFFTFFLQARKIISFVAKLNDELTMLTRMQTDLERLLQAEFPYRMIKDVKRETTVSGFTKVKRGCENR